MLDTGRLDFRALFETKTLSASTAPSLRSSDSASRAPPHGAAAGAKGDKGPPRRVETFMAQKSFVKQGKS